MKISVHSDADGISSVVLFLKAKNQSLENVEIEFPPFGEIGERVEYVFDMTPRDPNREFIVYDHHDQHPTERKYKLIFDNYPCARVVFTHHKDEIPKEEWWKVAVGCVGDGQPETIPTEVFREHRELLEKVCYLRENGFSSTAKYKLLSSPINYACRALKQHIAFKELYYAKSINDLIYNETLQSIRQEVQKEINKITKDLSGNMISVDPFILITINTDYKLSSLIASMYSNQTDQTIIVLNEKTGEGSIRGDLAMLLVEEMRKFGIEGGGHPGFCGFSVRSEIKDVKRLLVEIFWLCLRR